MSGYFSVFVVFFVVLSVLCAPAVFWTTTNTTNHKGHNEYNEYKNHLFLTLDDQVIKNSATTSPALFFPIDLALTVFASFV